MNIHPTQKRSPHHHQHKEKMPVCLVYVEKRTVIQSRVKSYPIWSNVNPTVTVTFTFSRVLDFKMADNCMLGLAPLLHKCGMKDNISSASCRTHCVLGLHTKSRRPLDHYSSILPTQPSRHNSYTCLYIHTCMHLFICSSISCVHLSHHVSRPCIHMDIWPLSGPSIHKLSHATTL